MIDESVGLEGKGVVEGIGERGGVGRTEYVRMCESEVRRERKERKWRGWKGG